MPWPSTPGSSLLAGLAFCALAACKPAPSAPSPDPLTSSSPPHASAPVASTSAASAPVASAPDEIPAPRGPRGPAFVLVEQVGVLRIDGGKVERVIPIEKTASSTSLALGPGGELWASNFDGLKVLGRQGDARSLPAPKQGWLLSHLIVRSSTEVWASQEPAGSHEWDLVRYDGKAWNKVLSRDKFPGKFSDNQLDGLAVASDGVWVSSWNGLWRGKGEAWEQIEAPTGPGEASGWSLAVYRGNLVAHGHRGQFLRDGDRWKALSWPKKMLHSRAISDTGLVAAPAEGSTRVLIGSMEGGPPVETEALPGSHVWGLAIDDGGRVWAGSDFALAVFDRKGRRLALWTQGALEGLSGMVRQIAVVGAGPEALPAAKAPRLREARGRLTIYKNDRPLAGARLVLCPWPGRCDKSSFRKETTSSPNGSFRFSGLPEGRFLVEVEPGSLPDCATPFTANGFSFASPGDCKTPDGDACDLGDRAQCLPFEMPPPRR